MPGLVAAPREGGGTITVTGGGSGGKVSKLSLA